MADTVVFAEQTLTFNRADDVAYIDLIPAPFTLAEGEPYRIVLNGAVYEACAFGDRPSILYTVQDNNGNTTSGSFQIAYASEEDCGMAGGAVSIAVWGESDTHTIAIYQKEKAITYAVPSAALKAVADAIRAKTGGTAALVFPNGMVDAIGEISAENVTYPLADKPETMGQVACLSRIKQMRDITYTPVAPLPYNYGTLPAGDPVTGIVYSAVRVRDNYVGYKISLHTFMTAIKNPKSFLYTKTASGTGNNVRCWYGVTCSTFVGYAYDFDYPIQTYIFPELEGIEEVAVEDMKLCDAANVKSATATTGGHIVIISGIERDADGNIVNVEITEANLKGVQATTMTYASFVSQYINSLGYKIYRNRKLYETSYKPSKYIRLFDDEPGDAVVYSDICTDWGDRAAIRTDEAITLNPINTDGYSAIKLYRNGEEIGNYGLTDVALSNLEVGTYTAKLYPEGENASTSFMVSQVYAEKEGNKYTFTAEGAKPLRIIFKDRDGFTLNSVKLESEDILLGYKEIDYSNESVGIIQVVFQNDFGYVLADCVELVELPEEYQEVEHIETSGGQYIDTGVLASNYQDGISYVFSGNRTGVTNASATTYLWGVSHNGARSGNLGITADKKYGVILGGTSGVLKHIDWSAAGEDFTIRLKATSRTAADITTVTATLDGVAFGNGGAGVNTDMPAANIYLFAANGIDTARGYLGKLYSFNMGAADGTPIRNFVPCYRKSDNVIGLYDTVEGKFYTNAGTGTFTKGADV